MNKQYAVFGVGSFGKSIALTLESFGCDVLVVDKNQEKIQEIADSVSYAVCADITQHDVIYNLGARNIDVAVVAISDNLEASILATILSKEMGIPNVISKAVDELQATVLRKVGADSVIFPEREMGNWLAKTLISKKYADWVEVTDEYSMIQLDVPNSWVGKSIKDIGVMDRHNVRIVGIIANEEMEMDVNSNMPLNHGSTLVVIGSNSSLRNLKML